MYIKDRIVDYYVNKSLNYYRVFKNKKAIEMINKILIFDKDNVDALSSKGLFYSYDQVSPGCRPDQVSPGSAVLENIEHQFSFFLMSCGKARDGEG